METSLEMEERDRPERLGGAAGWRNPGRWLVEKELGRGFWIFFSAAFFFDFGFAVYFFLFNLYLLDLHFNERVMGLVGGSLTLGAVVGTLPAGVLARKIGVRPLLLVCFISASMFGVLRAMAVCETAQIGLAFLAGIAMCLWGVCFLPALARLTTERNRASAFSLIFSVSIGTSALGGVVCGYLPQWLRAAGFPMEPVQVKRLILLGACGIAALGLIPLLWLRLPEAASETQLAAASAGKIVRRRRWRSMLRSHPFLVRFLPAMALWSATIAAFTPFVSVYLTRDLHVSLARVGLIFSVSQIIQFCMGLLTPMLFRRMGLVNGIFATQAATAIAVAGMAATQNRSLAVGLCLSLSATQWMSTPGLYNLLMSRVPDYQRSTASSATMFSNALLSSGATAAAGTLFAKFGYPRVLVGIAVFALTAALLFNTFVAPPGGAATEESAMVSVQADCSLV